VEGKERRSLTPPWHVEGLCSERKGEPEKERKSGNGTRGHATTPVEGKRRNHSRKGKEKEEVFVQTSPMSVRAAVAIPWKGGRERRRSRGGIRRENVTSEKKKGKKKFSPSSPKDESRGDSLSNRKPRTQHKKGRFCSALKEGEPTMSTNCEKVAKRLAKSRQGGGKILFHGLRKAGAR